MRLMAAHKIKIINGNAGGMYGHYLNYIAAFIIKVFVVQCIYYEILLLTDQIQSLNSASGTRSIMWEMMQMRWEIN